MSLLRAALGLGLLVLGLQAQKLAGHRKHHKHHKVLLSHGRSKYELVEPSAVVNDKNPEDQWRSMQAQVQQMVQNRQRIDSGPRPAKKLDSAEKDIKQAQAELQALEKQAEDQVPADAETLQRLEKQARHQMDVNAVIQHAKQVGIDKDDIKETGVHRELTMANADEDLNHIREELRLSKKKKHEIQVLQQSLAVEQKLLDESSSLQLASKDDEESEKMVKSQVHQLDGIKIKLNALIESKTAEATKASHQAEEEAKAMGETATMTEQKAEQELKMSKEIKGKAERLQKIAEKQLGKLEKLTNPADF